MTSTTLKCLDVTGAYFESILGTLADARFDLDPLAYRELLCMIGNAAEAKYLDEAWRRGQSYAADPQEHQLV
jgi:hypothetical protein